MTLCILLKDVFLFEVGRFVAISMQCLSIVCHLEMVVNLTSALTCVSVRIVLTVFAANSD